MGFLFLWQLDTALPLWWDEGWTLSVARNWVDYGHYGRLQNGEPATGHMSASVTVVAPIALSFRLLGTGGWQGRLPSVIYMLAALALLFVLAHRLYDRAIATGTLLFLVLLTPHYHLNPVLLGRQVLGEPSMFFFLTAGYLCLLLAWKQPKLFVPLLILAWTLALKAKLYVLPFWAASLLVPLTIAAATRAWRSVGLLGMALAGPLLFHQFLGLAQQQLLKPYLLPVVSGGEITTSDLYGVTAFVLASPIRMDALVTTIEYGLPVLLGIGYFAWIFLRGKNGDFTQARPIVRLSLFGLTASWLLWFTFFSAGFIRYLAPVLFFGTLFLVVSLRDVTTGFRLRQTIQRSAMLFRHFNRQNMGALAALLILTFNGMATAQEFYRYFFYTASGAVYRLADYLNTKTEPDALIETWNAELFFLLDRRYHFPPDDVYLQFQRMKILGYDAPIVYDPLVNDPDYLVFLQGTQLIYEIAGVMDDFRLVQTFSDRGYGYEVYARIR